MLTVLFATRDRAFMLREVLGSYCHLEPPPCGWKLVVVDNGSKDETFQVLRSFVDRLPLCTVCEPIPGKNHALNAGLALAEGDLTVFTDDDVFPRTDWLLQLKRAADAHPAFSIFGGVIAPRWEVPPPVWIQWLDVGPIFTITPPWIKEGELFGPHVTLVQGPNMAIRASIFQSGTRFDPCIGPSGASYPMGSETELVLRLTRHGYRTWHVQNAVVEHFVRQAQLHKDWILQRAVRYGRGWYRLAPKTQLLLGMPRHLYHDIPKQVAKIFAAWALSRQDTLIRARWRLNYLRGEAIEARILARERRMAAVIPTDQTIGDIRDRTSG